MGKVFDSYDPEKELSKEDFQALWKSLGFQEEYLETYFKAIDTNQSGTVSFRELMAGLTVCSGADTEKTAELLLKVYDIKGTGFLDREEFDGALASACKLVRAAVMGTLQPMLSAMLAGGAGIVMMSEAGEPTELDEEAKKKMIDDMIKDFPLPSMEDFKEAFDQIDANTDGKLTLPELTKALGDNPGIKVIMLPQVATKATLSSMGRCPVMQKRWV